MRRICHSPGVMLKLNAGLIANIHLMAGLTAVMGILNRFPLAVWARVVRQDEKILVLCSVRSGVWKLSLRRVAPALCPHLPGGPCSSTPGWAHEGSSEGKSAKVRSEVFGLFMAEILEKMEGNVLSAFLKENWNFLMFRDFFSNFFLKREKQELC